MRSRRAALGGLATSVVLTVTGMIGPMTGPAEAAAAAWRSVSAGERSTCGVRVDGTLWCWGWNEFGQLGNGSTSTRARPTQVDSGTTWATVSVGLGHACATRTDGSLWCWGANVVGELGDGTRLQRRRPRRVGTASDWVAVSASRGSFTCAVRTDRTLWCWGYDADGRLGAGPPPDPDAPWRTTPTPVLGGGSWASVETAGGYSCGIRTDTTLWCWGDNTDGVLGTGGVQDRDRPTQVGTSRGWSGVSAGDSHACATRADGTLWCWGRSDRGQLGTGDLVAHRLPHRVATGAVWAAVTAGWENTCALHRDGRAWCWGRWGFGTGPAPRPDRLLPTPVGPETGWTSLTQTLLTICGVRDGVALCWGDNTSGQVGDGTRRTRFLPTPVAG